MANKYDSQATIWLIVSGVVILMVGFLIFSGNKDRRGGTGECNNNYTGTCVPNVKYDIDCKAISASVSVVGKDVYNFDADADGIGCESN